MSNDTPQTKVEVTDPTFRGISTDHPSVVNLCRNMAKNGESKEKAMKLTGMPMEVVERHYREAKDK